MMTPDEMRQHVILHDIELQLSLTMKTMGKFHAALWIPNKDGKMNRHAEAVLKILTDAGWKVVYKEEEKQQIEPVEITYKAIYLEVSEKI